MSDPRLSLTWEAYQKNICNGLGLLQQRGEFVDMTIAADGHHVKVHQMVLSLVSPFIKDLITSAQCSHPVIFLNRVSYETLQLILEYVYTGEVLVSRSNLDDFLEACRSLCIKGLESDTMTSTTDKTILPEVGATDITESVLSMTPKLEPHSIQTGVKRKKTPISLDVEDDETFHETTPMDDDSQMEDGSYDCDNDNDEDTVPEKDTADSQAEDKAITGSMLQYSMSCQGSVQVVLNRFIYHMRHTRKNNEKMWRCADYNKSACSAFVVTKNNKVVERGCAHNHSFHDEQILKRVRCGNMYTAYNTVETMMLMKKKLPTT